MAFKVLKTVVKLTDAGMFVANHGDTLDSVPESVLAAHPEAFADLDAKPAKAPKAPKAEADAPVAEPEAPVA
jgi:hypothetical protein